MVFLWTSYGYPMGILWISYGFHIDILWTSYGFLINILWISCGFPVDFLWISCGIPMGIPSQGHIPPTPLAVVVLCLIVPNQLLKQLRKQLPNQL